MESKTGKKASEVSTEMAITTTLATVPNPGRWRIGIQSSSTTAPVIAVITPKLRRNVLGHTLMKHVPGIQPRPAVIIMAIEKPYNHRPTNSEANLRINTRPS